jgi:hypothetical protein
LLLLLDHCYDYGERERGREEERERGREGERKRGREEERERGREGERKRGREGERKLFIKLFRLPFLLLDKVVNPRTESLRIELALYF